MSAPLHIARRLVAGWLACLLLAASGCGTAPEFFAADAYPDKLSAWRLLNYPLQPVTDVFTYDLRTPLFSDYAHKQRTLYLPAGTTATYADFEAFEFPVGTIVSKTFYYYTDAEGRVAINTTPTAHSTVLETRLLVRQAHGWDALPYVWQGDDARLAVTGQLIQLQQTDGSTFNYLVPSRNQCASCHATDHGEGSLQPIGLKARHLNRRAISSPANQLHLLAERGWLAGLPALAEVPSNADMTADTALAHRARSYLDINCGHCHSATGAADTSALLLDYRDHSLAELGVCKPPIAAGRGSGGHLYSIVPGQAVASIMSFRMASSNPAIMMPELGRTLVDVEGVALINAWIDSLQGECR